MSSATDIVEFELYKLYQTALRLNKSICKEFCNLDFTTCSQNYDIILSGLAFLDFGHVS